MKFRLYSKDPKNQEQSVTLTLLLIGFFFCLGRLVLSNITICDYKFPYFSGSDFALVVGSLGALYTARKYTEGKYNTNVSVNYKNINSSSGLESPNEDEGS
jgi:hypothetical protein